MAKPVRTRISDKIVELLEGIEQGLPDGDPYSFQFDLVDTVPTGSLRKGKAFTAEVLQADETKQYLSHGVATCTLQVGVIVYMYVHSEIADPPARMVEVLGEVERAIHADRTLGGIAVDVAVEAVSVPIEEFDEREAMGVLALQARYRHVEGRPDLALGE